MAARAIGARFRPRWADVACRRTEQMRTARQCLARSLAAPPQVLLLDEPLAALDKKLRESTQLELMELQRKGSDDFIIVTTTRRGDDDGEPDSGVMDAGTGSNRSQPRCELYEAPASRWMPSSSATSMCSTASRSPRHHRLRS